MTMVYKVIKSRQEQTCRRGHPIPAGSAYNYATPGFRGRKIIACLDHPFRQSELTANDTLSEYYQAVEELEDSLAAWDGKEKAELIDALENARSSVGDCVSTWEEQIESMGTLAEGDAGQTIQERLEGAQDWLYSLESAQDDLENLGDPDADSLDSDAARQIVEDAIMESSL